MSVGIFQIVRPLASFFTGALLSLAVVSRGTALPATESVSPLLAANLRDLPGHRLTAVLVDYPPGVMSVAHHHAGSVFAYVVAGSIRSENSATGSARVYHVGQSFFEPAGSIHLRSANASATRPARLLAVFVAPSDAKLTTPEGHER